MSKKLDNWRKQIDQLDEKVLNLLAKRTEIVRKIGKFKKEQNISAFDKNRWEQVLSANIKKGETLGLSKEFIRNLLHLIHKYCLKIQKGGS